MEAENGNYPEQTTLKEILGIMAGRQDAVFNQIVFDDEGRVRRSLMVLINDEAIDRDDAQKLQDGDIIYLFPAISGG